MYFALYKTSTDEQKSFMTTGQDSLMFPPQAMYKNKAYRLVRTFVVSTPKQTVNFADFCAKNVDDINVALG